MGVATGLAFNSRDGGQGAGRAGAGRAAPGMAVQGPLSQPKPTKMLQMHGRGGCTGCGALSVCSRGQGREPHIPFLLLLKLLGKACVGGWPGAAGRLQPEQGGGEGLLGAGGGTQPLAPPRLCPAPWLGRSGGAGEGPAGRPVRGSGCPAHAQAPEKARQKYQMSWSNICTTFPAFTKKAFYTQSTLGDELGKQRGGSPLKLTLWLCSDKASASSSLM